MNDKNSYRRQFIASCEPIDVLPTWNHIKFKKIGFHVYAHPDLEVTDVSDHAKDMHIVLLGYILDPKAPGRTNTDIVRNFIKSAKTERGIATATTKLAGRYVIILRLADRLIAFNDAGGFRTVFYFYRGNKIHMGSQPSILGDLLNIQHSENYEIFTNSRHYKEDIEYWLPARATLYKDLNRLIPNHYLDISEKKQIRFWPNKKIVPRELEAASEEAASILKNQLYAASLRSKLALALTGGIDSRILLAACKEFAGDLYIYTVKNSRLKDDSYDITIPQSILKKLKLEHHIIKNVDPVDPDFYSIYNKNVQLSHIDWARNLNGLFYHYPQDRLSIQGNGSEIARCALYPDGNFRDLTSIDEILEHYWTEWKEIPFVIESFKDWFISAKETCIKYNMDIQDLFVLEQRTASWNAQANNEADIVTDAFSPFVHRPLLEIMLGVPSQYRQYYDSIMHRMIIGYLWPKLLYWPINLRWKSRDRHKHFIGAQLKRTGLYNIVKKIYIPTHLRYMKMKQFFFAKKLIRKIQA